MRFTVTIHYEPVTAEVEADSEEEASALAQALAFNTIPPIYEVNTEPTDEQ